MNIVAGTLGGGSQESSRGWRNDLDFGNFVTGTYQNTGHSRHLEENIVSHTLSSEGSDASEDETGRGTPIVSHALSTRRGATEDGTGRGTPIAVQCLSENQRAEVRLSDVSRQLTAGGGKPGQGYPAVMAAVPRRLTPRECERLQGFPDDWTRYAADGSEIADSPRYRMLGNAVSVPVSRWIGERLTGVR